MWSGIGACLLVVLLAGCEPGARQAVPVEATPEDLSGWHLLAVRGRTLELQPGVIPYDLNTPLFTDYAHKLRTVWMPPGAPARYRESGHFDFPVGTVFTKTFYYPARDGEIVRTEDYSRDFDGSGLDLDNVRLIETRILVKRRGGWDALPYVWNDEQTRAHLAVTGDRRRLSLVQAGRDDATQFDYLIPNRNECANCHATDHTAAAIEPIGPKARHLNKIYHHYEAKARWQLDVWRRHGYLAGVPDDLPKAAAWQPGVYDDLAHRARSYLDINCGHCHNPAGPADTSGLFLHAGETRPRRLGVCKPPVAAGRGSGGRTVSIWPGNPGRSILTYRMESTDPGAMMPEIGRTLVHREGVELVSRWIASLDGDCS